MNSAQAPTTATADQRNRWWHRLVQRKGHISSSQMAVLITLGGLPLLFALARIVSLPGGEMISFFGAEALLWLGALLNQWVSLEWVPPSDRSTILYLLMLPTGAMLIVIARLTFGLRVLGLRAILIGIGFQESGFLPSLILIAIVVAVVVAIRPTMRRIKLPMLARLAVVLCLAALIMIGALLIAPWVRSEAVWGVAFFPVIIVAMVAEGIAKTLANDNVVTAVWRAGWTLVIAGIMALIGQWQTIGEIVIQFPELLVTQLVLVVFIAEFFDLRLLEKWPDRIHRRLHNKQPWYSGRPRVAIVRNSQVTGRIGQFDGPAPAKSHGKSIRKHVNVLRQLGYKVRVFEGDASLVRGIKDFLPPEPGTGMPSGIVLNLATGTHGHGRFCQVPALLELSGIAFSGPDSLGHARLADRFTLLSVLRQANVPVATFECWSASHKTVNRVFPVVVRPRNDPDARKSTVADNRALEAAVLAITRDYGQDAIVEDAIGGRHYRIACIGNGTIECFPLLEVAGRSRVCPAEVGEALANRMFDVARQAYRALGCRDYARIDIRVDDNGGVYVTNVEVTGVLARRGSFAQAAAAADYDFRSLLARIIEIAAARYDAPVAELHSLGPAAISTVVPLSGREALSSD